MGTVPPLMVTPTVWWGRTMALLRQDVWSTSVQPLHRLCRQVSLGDAAEKAGSTVIDGLSRSKFPFTFPYAFWERHSTLSSIAPLRSSFECIVGRWPC